ncbi:MAG: hypothetical protein P8X81_08465 [Woeseiaceae bacterium]|jgi:hypothetical protein
MIRGLRYISMMAAALAIAACGGGGGGGGDGGGNGGGGGGGTGTTYTVELTAVEMTDTRTDQAVDATGLPITGATVTRN